MPGDARPIAVFDSGMGGLTVLRALLARLPFERFVYLGDTARLPYGTKSAETVQAYALQATRLLVSEGVKMVVVACNTASAVALRPLAEALAPVPVIGVIEPGARAGVAATRNNHIAVIATEGTVKGRAYARAIAALNGDITIVQQPCQVFVALAEEGWTDSPVTHAAAEHYLGPLFNAPSRPDTLVRLHAFPGTRACDPKDHRQRGGARRLGRDDGARSGRSARGRAACQRGQDERRQPSHLRDRFPRTLCACRRRLSRASNRRGLGRACRPPYPLTLPFPPDCLSCPRKRASPTLACLRTPGITGLPGQAGQ
jgi:glutamate racemase